MAASASTKQQAVIELYRMDYQASIDDHIIPGSYKIFKPTASEYKTKKVLIGDYSYIKIRKGWNDWATLHNSTFAQKI